MQQEIITAESVLAQKASKVFVVSSRKNIELLNGRKKSIVNFNLNLNPSVSNENYDCKLRPLCMTFPNIFKNVISTTFVFQYTYQYFVLDEPQTSNAFIKFDIPSGFFSINQLISEINKRARSAFTGQPQLSFPLLTYNWNQNRCSWIWQGTKPFELKVFGNQILEKLGFLTLAEGELPSSWRDFVGEESPNLSPLEYLYLHSPQLSGNTFSTELNSDFLAFIPVTGPYGSTCSYTFDNNTTCSFPAIQLSQQITFEFTDGQKNPLDFDGLDWTFVFEVTFVQIQNDTHSDFYRVIQNLHELTQPQFNRDQQTELLISEILQRNPDQIPFFNFAQELPPDADPTTE